MGIVKSTDKMSWSVQFIGKPENVVTALEKESAKLTDQSKVEFDSALPSLIGIVKENFGENVPLVKLVASGHGYAKDDVQVQRQLTVSVELIYGVLV